jgi:hypothetical protein
LEDLNNIIDEWCEYQCHLFLLDLRQALSKLRCLIDKQLHGCCPDVDGLFHIIKVLEYIQHNADLDLIRKEVVKVLLEVLDPSLQPLERLLNLLIVIVLFYLESLIYALIEHCRGEINMIEDLVSLLRVFLCSICHLLLNEPVLSDPVIKQVDSQVLESSSLSIILYVSLICLEDDISSCSHSFLREHQGQSLLDKCVVLFRDRHTSNEEH